MDNMNKIAVFSNNHRDFSKQIYMPENMFIKIKTIDDIQGRHFIGFMETHQWYATKEQQVALKLLNQRHPEIFE